MMFVSKRLKDEEATVASWTFKRKSVSCGLVSFFTFLLLLSLAKISQVSG